MNKIVYMYIGTKNIIIKYYGCGLDFIPKENYAYEVKEEDLKAYNCPIFDFTETKKIHNMPFAKELKGE